MRAVTMPGRLIWGISGVITMAALAVPGAHLITSPWDSGYGQQAQSTVTRSVTLSQPITSVSVQGDGASIQVTGGRVSHVRVTETTIADDPGNGPVAGPGDGALPVAASVRDGRLSVGGPECNWENCVGFTVTVPRNVVVTAVSEGAPVTVSGVAGVNLNSDGAAMAVSDIDGPVAVTTGGGPLDLTDVTGPLQADTGDGSLVASGITATTAMVTTEGGPAQLTGSVGALGVYTGGGSADVALSTASRAVTIDSGGGPARLAVPGTGTTPEVTISTEGGSARVAGSVGALGVYTGGGPGEAYLSTAPQTVTIDSDGGSATLAVPGGPYALTTDSEGAPQSVTIATNPAASRSITLTTGGGPLQIEP